MINVGIGVACGHGAKKRFPIPRSRVAKTPCTTEQPSANAAVSTGRANRGDKKKHNDHKSDIETIKEAIRQNRPNQQLVPETMPETKN